MLKPIIAISTQRDWIGSRRISEIGASYVNAVLRAGGIPVMLPVHLAEVDFAQTLRRFQGVIVTGGPDIHPAAYGADMHPKVRGIDVMRDDADAALVRTACDLKIPLLGICRGFQMINVVFGGELYTDVNEQHPGSLYHTCYPDLPYDLFSHTVRLEARSRLADILQQKEIRVNSLHHQGVRRAGAGLRITAHAPDGLVESVELPDHPFGLGVQWHPELLPEDPCSRALFAAFIQAAADQS